jgi:CMP-N,N'-diacetyllegionaminic acid synthase
MEKKPRIIGIIPARGGSKGIPEKNIISLAGKPLICYTIDAAKNSKFLNRIVVSTDDEKIATIAKRNGADVPFMRPGSLAKDDTPSVPVVQHAINFMEEQEGCFFDVIVLLQPTSPFRNEKYIDEAIKKELETGADSVITVCKVKHHPYWNFICKEDRLYPLITNSNTPTRRQDLPQTYAPNGAVYVVKRDILFNQNTMFGKDLRGVIMPPEESIDIDDYYDWFLAEMTSKYWKEWLNEKRKDRQ